MTMRKRAALLSAAFGLALGIGAVGAQAQTVEEIKSRGEINIGIPVDFPPFGLINQQGQPEGYDIDVANLIAEDLGVSVNLVPAAGQNRVPYLVSGRVDMIVSALGITAERAERVEFSQGYAGIEISVYGLKDLVIPDGAALDGVTIGVVLGATQDTAVTKVAPAGATIRRFDDNASANQALLAGQVQALGASDAVIALIETVAPGRFEKKFVLSTQLQGVATRPGADELLAHVNSLLSTIKQDGRLNAIHEKWLDLPLPNFIAEATEETTRSITGAAAKAN
ncbi:transporter substrate-binding domain-containing protein [Devosia sp. 2618]|uniref:transporter substrate-binding domain-containing protein n=1 Tax=Devosia sp. 2618 TaxID=3156454 RepID=UPI003396D70D